GYAVGDSLSAAAASIGGTGSGFSVPVASLGPSNTPNGCPMGIALTPAGAVLATLFTYSGYGCATEAVFSVTPDPQGVIAPAFNVLYSGHPLQYPFGMEVDESGNV